MATRDDLALAILAMDTYNRDELLPGIRVSTNQVGLGIRVPSTPLPGAVEASFAVETYLWGGKTVVAYRGTDAALDIPSWAAGGGVYHTAQTELAARVYNDLIASGVAKEDIVLTGHSLGGGLAGFVGMTYGVRGVLFENMAFEYAAQRLHAATITVPLIDPTTGQIVGFGPQDPVARSVFHGGNEPPAPDRSQLRAISVAEEVLADFRPFQATPDERIPLPNNVPLTTYDRHDAALQVVMLYGEVAHPDKDWHAFRRWFLPALYSQEVAASIDLSGFAGRYDPASKMRTMIAYSAIEGGVGLVFGDTAIRALFDDAGDAGQFFSHSAPSGALAGATMKLALGKLIVQFAGTMAKRSDANPDNFGGILDRTETGALAIDLTEARWSAAAPTGAGVTAVLDAVRDVAEVQGQYGLAVQELWEGDAKHLKAIAILPGGESSTFDPASVFELGSGQGVAAFGGGQDDTLTGSAGKDLLVGLRGSDTISGEGGDDIVFGGPGNDTLKGGAGNDWIEGGGDEDNIEGGAGNDQIFGGAGNDRIDGGEGNDKVRAGAGEDDVKGGDGNDELRGGTENDKLDGGDKADKLFGEGGADELNGGDDDDELDGGVGDDTLWGGKGADKLKGGGGADTFVFDTDFGNDTITGFQRTLDKLDFSAFGTLRLFEKSTEQEFLALYLNNSVSVYGTADAQGYGFMVYRETATSIDLLGSVFVENLTFAQIDQAMFKF